MQLQINGEPAEAGNDTSLQALVDTHNREDTPVAVAVNGRFVPRSAYGEVALKEGDEIELLAPMMGG